jgi:hypothetical protein
MVVREDFIKSLNADPSGTRKTAPTIWDELRHATQHSQRPLEQVLQLISEFHGPWTGVNPATVNLLVSLLGMFSNKANKDTIKQVRSALSALQNVASGSSIGRVNNIVANNMSVPMLRAFVSRSQAIHPSVNTYIQQNAGKYPYFQQISEQVGSFGQAVIQQSDIHPIKRIQTSGLTKMNTDYPIRRNTDRKVFGEVSANIDLGQSFVNTLFLRAQNPEGNNAILLDSNNTSVSHGYSLANDVANENRVKKTVAPCLAEAVKRFGPTTQLLDSYFPVEYQVKLEPEYFEIQTENGSSFVDKLNRPMTRVVPLPVAKQEDIVQIA